MPSLQNIRKRIKGVKAVNKITSAMELVAATKMRRAQETAINSRGYAFASLLMLSNIIEMLRRQNIKLESIPLLRRSEAGKPEAEKRAILLVASDKGLAGNFNSAVFRKYEEFIRNQLGEKDLIIIAVGQKAHEYAVRKKLNLVKSFSRHGDIIDLAETAELAEFLINGFTKGDFDELTAFSMNFVNALKQIPVARELLPIDFQKIRETVNELVPETGRYSNLKESVKINDAGEATDYLIEPSPETALAKLVPALFKMQIYQIILESNASEHSARRVAMKNASDNAQELSEELTSIYNRARQEQITKELLEITGAARALSK